MRSFSFLQQSRFRIWGSIGLGVLLAGCGGGSSDSGGLADSGGLEQTLNFGGLTTRIAGTIQPPVTSGGGGATVTGVAGATINSLSLKSAPASADVNNTKIAFYSNMDGNFEIYTMNVDGSGLKRLTYNSASDAQPAWSPDGTKIAFYSNRSGNGDVWVMNADGSNPVNRTSANSTTDGGPSWSPDGTKIVFQRWNSDNTDSNLFVMNADGSNPSPLATHADQEQHPVWSPDGTQIAYQRKPAQGGNWEIYTMNSDGSSQMNRTGHSDDDVYPAWSPDSRKIVFQSSRGGHPNDSEIYTMNADGTNQIPLTENTVPDSNAYYSPDGNKIVFTREVSSVVSIYTMNATGANLMPIYQASPSVNIEFTRWAWPSLASRNLIGSGGTLGNTAAGFIFGQNGANVTSLLTFDSDAATRAKARIATTTGIASGLSNYLFTITHTTALTSVSFTNDFYASPTVVIGPGSSLAPASSVLVSYDASNGKVAAVLPYEATRAAQPAATESGSVVTLRGQFLGAWDDSGKNRAPNGATEVRLDASTGRLISVN